MAIVVTEGRALKALMFDQCIHAPSDFVNDTKYCIDHMILNIALIFSNNNIISQAGVRPNIASDYCPILPSWTKIYKILNVTSGTMKKVIFLKFQHLLLDVKWHECCNIYNDNTFNVVVKTIVHLHILFNCILSCIFN